MGMANTNRIISRLTAAGSVSTSNYAAGIASAYSNIGKTDWHLPSIYEVNQMCKWQRGVAWTSDATVCSGGTLNSGPGVSGFSTNAYWSSSETALNTGADHVFNAGAQRDNFKNAQGPVRVVRAFGPTG